MKLQATHSGLSTVRGLPQESNASRASALEVAEQRDLVSIGSSQEEMGLGQGLAALVGGGVGGGVGVVGGLILGSQHWEGVLGTLGGGVTGLVAGAVVGGLIGYALYSSSGDFI